MGRFVAMMMVSRVEHRNGGRCIGGAGDFEYHIAFACTLGFHITTIHSGREFFCNTLDGLSGNHKLDGNFVGLYGLIIAQMGNMGKDECLLACVQLADLGKNLDRVAVGNNVDRLVSIV